LVDQSWIANAYILTNTAFLPLYGQVADIFGRHITMQSAIFVFLVGSALCTGAQTWGMILAGRAIAGIGGLISINYADISRGLFRDVKDYHE
jgi:MFS family permease